MDEDYKKVEFQYGIVMLRTKRFQSIMDRLGRLRISKPVGWALLYLMPVAAGIGLFVFLANLAAFFSPEAHEIGVAVRGISPLSYLGLPGINPYLPIVDGWVALVFAMIVHEGAHGIVARSLGLPVKTSGLLFFLFVPIGAFVEVDESSLKAARARDSGRVLAAGAGVNLVLGIVFLLILFSVVSTMTPAARGVAITAVADPSPAATAHIQPGEFILAVNGVPYDDPAAISSSSWYRPGQMVKVTLWDNGKTVQDNLTLGANPANSSEGYIGIEAVGYTQLADLVSGYTGSFLSSPALYICIPTFPRCEGLVPFSSQMVAFYTSSYGGSLVTITGLLYWLFFLNFNLAVFNALPIYPLDGGQAFRAGLKGLAGRRLSEKALTWVTVGVTVAVLALIFSFPLAAYLNLV